MKRAPSTGRQANQANKRPKKQIPKNIYPTTDHKPGSVIRVTLTNFLTYDSVTVYPGPHLNVLIGPNGSGKSTIVCALCLGLGGGAKLLGRSKETTAFIKHGCDWAEIEIELKGTHSRNTIIHREIRKSRAADVWKLNGKPSTKDSVIRAVKEFDIQIENLCQFLPQDKVVAFAQLNPYELLKETEKAVGGQKMLQDHLELITMKKEIITHQETLTTQTTELNELKEKNKNIEEEVNQFHKRASILQEAKILKRKRPWVEFEQSRQQAVAAQDDFKAAAKEYEAANKEIAPLQEEAKKQKNTLAAYDNKLEKNRAQIRQLDLQRSNRDRKIETTDNNIEAIRSDIASLQDREKERKKKIEKINNQLVIYQKEIDALRSPDEIKAELATLDTNMRTVKEKIEEQAQTKANIEEKIREFETEIKQKAMELRDLEDARKQKIATMQREAPDLHQTYVWYSNNKQLFEQEVIFPFLEMSVVSELHARYIENRLSRNMWIVLCQTDKDRATVAKQTDARGWKIMSVRLPDGDLTVTHPFDIGPLRAHGITNFLDDLLVAPPIIKKVMVELCGLNICIAGTAKTEEEEHLKHVLYNGTTVYTPRATHVQSQSRYGNKTKTTATKALKQVPVKLVGGVESKKMQEKLRAEEAQLREEVLPWKSKLKQCGEVERDLQHKLGQFDREKSALLAEGRKKKAIEGRMGPLIADRESHEIEENIEAEEQQLQAKIKTLTMQKLSLARDMFESIREMTKHSLDNDATLINRIQAKAILTIQEQSLAAKLTKVKLLELTAQKKKTKLSELKSNCKALLDIAQSTGKLDDTAKELFAPLPNTVEEIDIAILDCQRRADDLFISNPRVVEDFENRSKKIRDLQMTADQLAGLLQSYKNKVEATEEPWYNKLKALQGKITEKFSRYMAKIGCSGEVRIQTDEDYDKWGMQILVKFRPTQPLAVLDAHHQSGGERSVATMLYLISLHDLTPCPFRVVDEINQGMDPVNERMIFQQVVNAACQPGLPQYFLITPKLLTNLQYSEGVTVLCVFNGPWLPPNFASQNCNGGVGEDLGSVEDDEDEA